MLKIKQIAHIGIAVSDMESTKAFYQDVLGLECIKEVDLPAKQNKLCFFAVGDSALELVAPAGEQSAVAEVIANKGVGPYHIALRVDDVDVSLQKLREVDIKLRNQQAMPTPVGGRNAFLEVQQSAGDILFELCDEC